MSFNSKNVAGVEEIDQELIQVNAQIIRLESRRRELQAKREKLLTTAQQESASALAKRDWDRSDFPWSEKLNHARQSMFKCRAFRPLQQTTMNACLSGHDVMLIMPTGGGKSLCYQLPAVISKGMALVISPLIALMEDQTMALNALGLKAAMLSASSSKDESKFLLDSMVNQNSDLKLIYVTPERISKSKRFMTKLQKMYEMGRLSMIAIDEAHCCSQWGHDFRPDYKHLSVLRSLFEKTPIMCLTATATAKIVDDVKDILGIPLSIVIRSTFNRPNLFYEVRPKPSSLKEQVQEIQQLLSNDFKGMSGIIYTLSIKDCESLATELKALGVKVGAYHANLEAVDRRRVHIKWLKNDVQAIVATVAFGMGIDKPDVRFVIHHTISKSMENYYQESGRAGRDDSPSRCIAMFRFQDVFRLSSMVFTDQTGIANLYSMLQYCTEPKRCRRKLVASHFGEEWSKENCGRMCDNCSEEQLSKRIDITAHCICIYSILQHAITVEKRLTGQKLVDSWMGKSGGIRPKDVKPCSLSRENCERVILQLLVDGYLKEEFHYTAYTTISYLALGSRSPGVLSRSQNVFMEARGKRNTCSFQLKPSNSSSTRDELKKSKQKGNGADQHGSSLTKGRKKELSNSGTTQQKELENNATTQRKKLDNNATTQRKEPENSATTQRKEPENNVTTQKNELGNYATTQRKELGDSATTLKKRFLESDSDDEFEMKAIKKSKVVILSDSE